MAKHKANNIVKTLEDWRSLEDETISLAEKLMQKSNNSFIKLIMEMIRRDSEKHKSMLQFTIDHLTKEAIELAPQDLIPLAEVLEKHLAAEAKSMGLANQAITQIHDYFANFVISYLLADEVKHHEMLTRLDQIKGQVYPYGAVRMKALENQFGEPIRM